MIQICRESVIVRRYSPVKKSIWDSFVAASKNGTFLFERDYMDYHADRFEDFSLMLFEGEALRAVLPASHHDMEIRSHGGLSYGGLICGLDMTASLMLQCFNAIKTYLADNNIKTLLYKRVPYIYYRYPSDEDLYALFINQALLLRRDISCCIFQSDRIPFNERRRRNIKKAIKAGLQVRKTDDYETYMALVSKVLSERYGVTPVHTAREIAYLARLFPNNIRLFAAYNGMTMFAGVIIYETPLVAHAQYLASSADGREVGALDIIIDYLVNKYYQGKRYFDFGICTEKDGRHLNEGLISQKQEFGGRGVVHEFYKLNI